MLDVSQTNWEAQIYTATRVSVFKQFHVKTGGLVFVLLSISKYSSSGSALYKCVPK